MWMQFKLPASHHHHQPWKKGGGELIHQQWDSLSLSLRLYRTFCVTGEMMDKDDECVG